MILRMFGFENDLKFSEDTVGLVNIKRKKLFINIITSINMYYNGVDGIEKLIFLDNEEKKINMQKDILVINNFFESPFSDRKTINKLYEKLEGDFNTFYNRKNEILSNIQNITNIIEEIMIEYDIDVCMDRSAELSNIFKMLNLKLNTDYNKTPLENVNNILDVLNEIKLYKAIILIDAYSKLDYEEVEWIIKKSMYKKIPLVLIENDIDADELMGVNILEIDETYDDTIIIK